MLQIQSPYKELINDIVDDTIILFDRNSFFHNILKTLRERLTEMGAIKKRIGKK